MQTPNNYDDYELRDEYDLSEMTVVAKGRYAAHRRTGKNVILLEPDVMKAFPTDESVNEALRLAMRLAMIPVGCKPKVSEDCLTNKDRL
jgi:hypothetical protein